MTIRYSSYFSSPEEVRRLDPLYTKLFLSPHYLTAAIAVHGLEPFRERRELYSRALYVFNEIGTAFPEMGLKRQCKPVSRWKDEEGRIYADERRITLASPRYGSVVNAKLARQILAGTAGLEVVVHREAAARHGAGKKRGEEAVEEYLRRIEKALVCGTDILNDGIVPEHILRGAV